MLVQTNKQRYRLAEITDGYGRRLPRRPTDTWLGSPRPEESGAHQGRRRAAGCDREVREPSTARYADRPSRAREGSFVHTTTLACVAPPPST